MELNDLSGDPFFSIEIAGNTVYQYLIAVLIFFISMLVLRFFKHVLLTKLKEIAKETSTHADDVLVGCIEKIGWPFYFFISLFISLEFIFIPPIILPLLSYIIFVFAAYYTAKTLHTYIDHITAKVIEERQKDNRDEDTHVIHLLGTLAKSVLWIVAGLFILSNLGYDIEPMIAGFGIAGIAIAFALQNVLTDIFASFSIYFDKPFRVGDSIVVGNDAGIVKKIGIKSTRLTTFQGEELVISNKELTESRIHNHKKMQRRRISFNFGVTYDTSIEKLKKIPDIIKSIILAIDGLAVDRIHFKQFGDSALIYEVVYYINTNDYMKYMDAQQAINLALKQQFDRDKIEMAFPTHTVYVNKVK